MLKWRTIMTTFRELQRQERQDRDNKIIGLVKDGYSLASVGDVFGLSARQVKNILYRVGYKKPKPVNPDHVEMLRLRNEGCTLQVIGDKYGITRERVRQITDKMGYVKPVMPSKEEVLYRKKQDHRKKRIAEFWKNVFSNGEGCWEWIGYLHPKTGYGLFGMACVMGSSKDRYAHRISWTLKHGMIPKGLFVLHKCDNPACVNPKHLYLGTQKQNIKDREERFKGIHWKDRDKNKVPRRKVVFA